MPPSGGKRTSLASYTWGGFGSQNDITQFRDVFQPDQGIFSPGYPLVPPERERVRVWDFPVGYNTIYTPRSYDPIGFHELRALAENHDITRLAIETRKDQIEKLDWAIRSRNEKRPAMDARERVSELTEFWRKPDGEQPFATWLRELLEDLLVLDAPTLELRRNRAGEIIGLDVVDGATIKVLIDDTGRRPQPPAPAYEQIIHGRPWRLLTSDHLLYLPRNKRPHKAYGFGPCEQIVMTINIGLRRQLMQLQHFTEGNVPPGLVNAPDGWNAEQIRQFQEWFELDSRWQYRHPHPAYLGPNRSQVPALQGSALQRRVRRMAGAYCLLRLFAAADCVYAAGQSGDGAICAGDRSRRGAGAIGGLGQAARRHRHSRPHGPCRSRICLVGCAVDRSQGSGGHPRHLCQGRGLYPE